MKTEIEKLKKERERLAVRIGELSSAYLLETRTKALSSILDDISEAIANHKALNKAIDKAINRAIDLLRDE